MADDPATDYARAVCAGEIVAGPHVRDACARHLRDLEREDLYFDTDAAEYVFDFYRHVLRLNGGEFEALPFELLAWQKFVIGSIFGWKRADTGYRRFRLVYIETGKGSGKSPLVAGIGLYGLTADDEPRAEVYAAAVKKDQAKVLFRDAEAMVQMSEDLAQVVRVWGGGDPHNLTYEGSFFKPISSEDRGKGQSGPRPHIGIIDEVHEHPTDTMIEMMRAGRKNRRQPLTVMITNSGNNRGSPCWAYHDYAAKICAGELVDDTFFGYVCALDEGEDPFEDETCWIKANPSLPAIPGMEYLREQVHTAKGLPSTESKVRRLNFCEWVEGANPLFSKEVWLSTLHDLHLPDYEGRECIAALDLSSSRDLTALALGFPGVNDSGEKTLDAFVFYWTPKDTLDERAKTDGAPYPLWVREGYLNAVPGKAIDYSWVVSAMFDMRESHEFTRLYFDRFNMKWLRKSLDDEGFEYREKETDRGSALLLVEHGQGFRDMGPAIREFEKFVLNGCIRIQRNPVTTMCAANTAIDVDPTEAKKFAKNRSNGRIDGMVALAMLAGAAASYEPPKPRRNIYDEIDLASA